MPSLYDLDNYLRDTMAEVDSVMVLLNLALSNSANHHVVEAALEEATERLGDTVARQLNEIHRNEVV